MCAFVRCVNVLKGNKTFCGDVSIKYINRGKFNYVVSRHGILVALCGARTLLVK